MVQLSEVYLVFSGNQISRCRNAGTIWRNRSQFTPQLLLKRPVVRTAKTTKLRTVEGTLRVYVNRSSF